MSYAWIIDRDHLSGPGAERPAHEDDATGVTGPSDAPEEFLDVLTGAAGEFSDRATIYTFGMYDGDQNRYYTGRMITDDPDEQACAGPLDDYGRPGSGCVEIRYSGHPEMDIG